MTVNDIQLRFSKNSQLGSQDSFNFEFNITNG